ncbi:hypothetical protein ACFVV7_34070 [Streptomyces globisporus]|uniref:hypothetical protein n=1 Tax=Streptomyces globisporus TaxID=1908 RepID=UPI0036DEF0C2
MYELGCPECGTPLGRHAFLPLAKRVFEEHVDEEHPSVTSPLEQVRTLVDLADVAENTWTCEIAGQTYTVQKVAALEYTVRLPGRGALADTVIRNLDDARMIIGGHAGIVSAALRLAASVQLRRVAPTNSVPLA